MLDEHDMLNFCDALEARIRQLDSSYDVRLQVMPAMHSDIYVVTIENASNMDQYHVNSTDGAWIRIIHG